jgi:hypothetical protein
MKGLLLHSLVVSPAIRWITSPSRPWKYKTGLNIAIVTLIAIAVLQLKRMDVNCFDLLEVPYSASPADVSKAYRRMSIQYHPDSVSGSGVPYNFESSEALFIELQKCSDIITNPTKRSFYNRFGKVDLNIRDESTVFPVMAVFSFIGYLVNFVVCMVLTASSENKAGRWWITSFIVFAFTSEIMLRYLNLTEIFSYLPYIGSRLVFQQINILKELIPSVLSSAILLSQLTHQPDEIELVNHILRCVKISNFEIAKFLNDPTKDPNSVPLPAALKLTQPQKKVQPTTTPASAFPIGRILQFLFWAYVAKIAFNALSSLFV